MSNKKSRKFINIMLSAMMLLGVSADQSFAAEKSYGKNGVSYVLLSSDFSSPGVYRFNKFDGKIRDEYINPNTNVKTPLFKINTIEGKVSGLAANQENNVFLLSAIEGNGFKDADPGWLPTGIKFDDNSAIYLSAAKPNEGGAVDYIRTGCPHITDWNTHTGSYWKHDYTINNVKYKYVVTFGGPKGVKYFNGESGTTGTPIWDGTYTTGGISKGPAIKHPTDERKIILPSHFGALSYYLYGTKNEPAIEGLVMDGSNGRDTYIFTDATGRGVFPGDSKHGNATMFGCIVKRFYQKRENSLNLYAGNDTTVEGNVPSNQPMTQTQSNVLKTVDVKVREAYGKLCGDNCIDGGEIAGAEVETALSTVTVVTSTTGNRYGFNPLGVYRKADTQDQTSAALRVVKTNGTTKTVDLSTDKEGQIFSPEITNKSYLTNQNITPAEIRTIGISSKFGSDLDYIYGSGADYFVVQDSWWGKGGVAYEYYKGNEETPGKVLRIDYLNNDNQTNSINLGDLTGKVDGIGVDGDGFLYALKTEEFPSNSQMEAISLNPDPTSKKTTIAGNDFSITFSGWRRDKQTTNEDETLNDGYIDIPDGQEQEGDYKLATIKQNVYKTIKRYPQANEGLGLEEDRGSMFAGYDTWTNKLKMTKRSFTWDYPQWREEEGTRTSDMLAELAVVNVADAPKSLPGTDLHYIVTTEKDLYNSPDPLTYISNQPTSEESSYTFKVEGYKPVINNERKDFKEIGDIDGSSFANVKLNSIPNNEGVYAHDEDGDGIKSGFPSSMFEAKNYYTKVVWHYAQVEDTEPVSLSSAKIIKKFPSVTTSSETNKWNTFTPTFSEPGRYIIQAEVTYNYFNNLGQSGIRPYQLNASTKSFTTQPKLVSVYANALALNKTPSYITNIDIKYGVDNKQYGITGSTDSGADLDTTEGGGDTAKDTDRLIGSFTISFDAKFYSEANSYNQANLETSNGIGVWDYLHYQQLYRENKAYIPSIIVPDISITSHVYNYVGGSGLTTCYNPNVYNPGRAKATSVSGKTYTAGTEVNGEPNSLDKSFIQWALYLRPITPQGGFSLEKDTIYDRGTLIKNGTCADENVTFIDKGNRNYQVLIPVNNIDSQIYTPRDPGSYTLDLEIIYPRVTWLNNDLGANLNDGHNYFSSVVPYTESCGAKPIHVLSKLNIGGSNGAVNQSYKRDYQTKIDEDDKTSEIFATQPHITICARDKELPTFEDKTEDLPYYETTGDPTIAGNFKYQIKDNNPFLSVSDISGEANFAKIENNTSTQDATNLVIQDLISEKFTDDDSNKKYITRSDATKKIETIAQTSDNSGFFKDDNWRIWIDYSVKMDKLSPDRFSPQGTTDAPTQMIDKNAKIKMENWVGKLKYAVTGKFYDGYGIDSKYSPHYLYNESVYKNLDNKPEDLSIDDTIKSEPKEYLHRIDNDPPTIKVELISQSDNRRWDFQLIEGINDIKSCAKEVDNLAKSKLIVTEYHLNNENIKTTNQEDVDGTTAYPERVGVASVTTNVAISDPKKNVVPAFRRASRLLINVDIFDNCGFTPLSEAWIKVENNNSVLFEKPIKEDASHDIDGMLKDAFKNKPRGVFSVDLPMQVSDTQPQLKVTVYGKDKQGNDRALIMPVNLVESSFETRVLETKEERN